MKGGVQIQWGGSAMVQNLNPREVRIRIFALQGTGDTHSFYSANLPLTFFATVSSLVLFPPPGVLTSLAHQSTPGTHVPACAHTQHTHPTHQHQHLSFQNLC